MVRRPGPMLSLFKSQQAVHGRQHTAVPDAAHEHCGPSPKLPWTASPVRSTPCSLYHMAHPPAHPPRPAPQHADPQTSAHCRQGLPGLPFEAREDSDHLVVDAHKIGGRLDTSKMLLRGGVMPLGSWWRRGRYQRPGYCRCACVQLHPPAVRAWQPSRCTPRTPSQATWRAS